jgi:hypothetical protein
MGNRGPRATPKIDRVLARLGTYPGPEPCWLWPGSLTITGYGKVGPGPEGGTGVVHWITYLHMVGPVPDGLDLDHTCHTADCPEPAPCSHRRCANPAHLEPVTRQVNLARGKHNHRGKTHCKQGHEFTPENTYVNPNRPGWRNCRQCQREAVARYRANTLSGRSNA